MTGPHIRSGLIVTLGIGLLLFVWNWSQPSDWVVSRQVLIDAPAGVVFPLISKLSLGSPGATLHDQIVSSNSLTGADFIRRDGSNPAATLRVQYRMIPDPRGVVVLGSVSGHLGWNSLARFMPQTMDTRYGVTLQQRLDGLKEKAESEWKTNRPSRPIVL